MHTLTSRPPLFSVLAHKKFLRLWISQMCSQLAINMMLFLMAFMVYNRTQSNAAVSGLFLAYGLPSLFFGMVAGAIVDRVDRRLVLVVSHLARAFCIWLLYVFSFHLAVIYLVVFINAIITQLTTPAEVPLIPEFVPKSYLLTANSMFSFTFYASMASGFILSGPILRLIGPDGSYLLLAGLFLLAALCVYGLPWRGGGLRTFTRFVGYNIFYILRRILTDLENGFRYVSRAQPLRDSLFLLTMTQIMLVILGTLGPGFADTVLHIDIRDASLYIVGPIIIGILVGAIWVGNVGYKYTSQRLILVGVFGAGTTLMLVSGIIGFASAIQGSMLPPYFSLVLALSLFFILGVANSFLDVPSNSILQRESQGEMRGRVYGMLSAAVGGAGILPIVLSGVLADLVGVGSVIFVLGGVIFLYGLYLVRYYKILMGR